MADTKQWIRTRDRLPESDVSIWMMWYDGSIETGIFDDSNPELLKWQFDGITGFMPPFYWALKDEDRPPPYRPICADCDAFDQIESECRRRAPQFFGCKASWPEVERESWCCEFSYRRPMREKVEG